jgi:tRNA uracil 4-sulfurtransferase
MIGVCLLSSGIDSPVAAFVLSKFVDELVLLHADGRPFTDNRENENFLMIARHLSTLVSCRTRICMVPHGKSLEAYKTANVHPRFCCVFCKRMMIRYADAYAKGHDADFIVMGDSLGQVASQTLANIVVVDESSDTPILRPLIGYDKEEIIDIARTIGTFDLSIKDSVGCLAVPSKPSTMARVEQLEDVESYLPIQDLVDNAINSIQYIE